MKVRRLCESSSWMPMRSGDANDFVYRVSSVNVFQAMFHRDSRIRLFHLSKIPHPFVVVSYLQMSQLNQFDDYGDMPNVLECDVPMYLI
jgi:hypothetical protein